MARPKKLTPELQEVFCELLRDGAGIENAAAKVRVGRRTIYDWLKLGDTVDGDPACRDFANAVREARADDELAAITILKRFCSGTISVDCKKCKTPVKVPVPDNVAQRSIEFYLERKYPDSWGGRIQIDHKVTKRMQELVDEVEPLMSAGAHQEFLNAIGELLGFESDLVSEEAGEGPPG